MKNLTFPQLQEMETQEGHILQDVVQIFNYICVAPTINRQTLVEDVMRVATTYVKNLNDRQQKISCLEKQLSDLHEEIESGNETNYEDSFTDAESSNCSEHSDNEDESDDLIGATIVSPSAEYMVQDIMGSGVSAVVTQCQKMPSNETVALKMIKDVTHTKMAREEAKALEYLKALGCEDFNIVTFKSSFVFDDHFCMEFKLLDRSLLDFIRDNLFLTLDKIRPILQQAAVALRFLKRADVVHTDLKPDNIMLVDRSLHPLEVEVIDFGLAIQYPEEMTGCGFQALWYRSPEIVLGAPFGHAIDMWSLGCIAAEMLMGTPLFPTEDENELMEYIVGLLGQPSDQLLDRGIYTEKFFDKGSSGDHPRGWTLKLPAEYGPQNPSTKCADEVFRNLFDHVKPPDSVYIKDRQAFEWDRMTFIDLLAKMLHVDPAKRITPEEMLAHPFITLSHLDKQSHTSYVESSLRCMNAYNNKFKFLEKQQNAQRHYEVWDDSETVNSNHMVMCNAVTSDKVEHDWLPTSTTVSTSNHLANEHYLTDLSREEQASTQDVLKEETSSCDEIHLEVWDDSESVNRSPQSNEEETQSTTCDCSSPLSENIQSNNNTNSRLGKRNMRRRQQRKAKKQNTKSSD